MTERMRAPPSYCDSARLRYSSRAACHPGHDGGGRPGEGEAADARAAGLPGPPPSPAAGGRREQEAQVAPKGAARATCSRRRSCCSGACHGRPSSSACSSRSSSSSSACPSSGSACASRAGRRPGGADSRFGGERPPPQAPRDGGRALPAGQGVLGAETLRISLGIVDMTQPAVVYRMLSSTADASHELKSLRAVRQCSIRVTLTAANAAAHLRSGRSTGICACLTLSCFRSDTLG